MGGKIPVRKTTPVKTYFPNDWGLFDMHGNVFEWCWDRIWYSSNDVDTFVNYYGIPGKPVPEKDPIGLTEADRRAERGGSFQHPAYALRSAYRERARPNRKLNDLGFRVVRPLPGNTW
jgi:formylglycine-generating enzyme required for sulfatase activity